jgi:hypothetical protein
LRGFASEVAHSQQATTLHARPPHQDLQLLSTDLSTHLRISLSEGYKVQLTEVQIGMTLPHFAIEVSRQRLTPSHYHLAAGLSESYTPQGAVVGAAERLKIQAGLISRAI